MVATIANSERVRDWRGFSWTRCPSHRGCRSVRYQTRDYSSARLPRGVPTTRSIRQPIFRLRAGGNSTARCGPERIVFSSSLVTLAPVTRTRCSDFRAAHEGQFQLQDYIGYQYSGADDLG